MATNADQELQSEFNQWAADGRGDEMERHHLPIFVPALAHLHLQPGVKVLDIGCGSGWASLLVAREIGPGEVLGIDISDEMIRRAAQQSIAVSNVRFLTGSADNIPAPDQTFDRIFSIESFYYWPDQHAGLREIARVLKPGGELFILSNLYRDNPYSLRWMDALAVKTHALSEAEYLDMLRRNGFVDVAAKRIPDASPTPDDYSGKWFKNSDELRDFKRIGALLLLAKRPTTT